MEKNILAALEELNTRLRDHNEQQLRAYIATINLQHSLSRIPLVNGEKIRIHFVFMTEAYWSSWATFYRACREDARMDVKLILLSSLSWKLSGRTKEQAEDFLHSNKIPYLNYTAYDPFAERPHILVYQYPYNAAYLNFPRLKPNYIKQAGIRPVYIPYGLEYDAPEADADTPDALLNIMHYRKYVQLFAWKIIALHEDCRDGFFRHCLAGGAHVAVLGSPKFDAYADGTRAIMPEYLMKKAAGRSVLLWQVHHFWRDPGDAVSAPDRTHSLLFAETRRIAAWLHTQPGLFSIVTLHPLFSVNAVQKGCATPEEVEEFKDFIRQSPNMALHTGEYQPLIAGADAFITEKSSLMLEMAFMGKPTLFLQDLRVSLKPFARDIVSSFYQGGDLEAVKEFIRVIKGEAPDTLAGERKRIWETYYAGCDGRIGERIKEYLIQCLLAEQ
jgi:hypothetical protein